MKYLKISLLALILVLAGCGKSDEEIEAIKANTEAINEVLNREKIKDIAIKASEEYDFAVNEFTHQLNMLSVVKSPSSREYYDLVISGFKDGYSAKFKSLTDKITYDLAKNPNELYRLLAPVKPKKPENYLPRNRR